MGLIPDQSFTVREPAWWDTSREYVLQEYPGREQAMELAGHNWDVIELPSYTAIPGVESPVAMSREEIEAKGFVSFGNGWLRKDERYVSHVRSDNLVELFKATSTFERIHNSVAYDVAEILFEEGYCYETAGSMDEGRQNYLTLLLNEPITIPGDDSPALPFGALSWAHDGSASLKVRTGTIRQVCQNTVAASEAEGDRLGTQFVFRHTKNVMERIEEAKKVVRGAREDVEVYVEAMQALAEIQVTPDQRELFVSRIIGDAQKDGGVPLSLRPDTSSRVKTNIEAERMKVLPLFMGPTIPEAHRLTGYGLFQAGVEYFDHLRAYRSKDSYVKRTLLTNNPAKAQLAQTVREVAQVG